MKINSCEKPYILGLSPKKSNHIQVTFMDEDFLKDKPKHSIELFT
jgi:hypothetical protein